MGPWIRMLPSLTLLWELILHYYGHSFECRMLQLVQRPPRKLGNIARCTGWASLPAVAHVARCYVAQIGLWFLFYSIVGGGVAGSTHMTIHFIYWGKHSMAFLVQTFAVPLASPSSRYLGTCRLGIWSIQAQLRLIRRLPSHWFGVDASSYFVELGYFCLS